MNEFHDDFSGITKVLVVEKDTVFQRLIQMELLTEKKELLIVTAKGYPDYATRRFLRILWQQGVSLFYIGDADPCGAEIFFTYVFGSQK